MKMNLALLVLRVSFGGIMLVQHGWGKLLNFTTVMATFPDPIGVGSLSSLLLCVFAEVFCAAFIVAGLLTRFAAVALIINMAVAVFIVHGTDPFAKKELATLYLVGYLMVAALGPGILSLDKLAEKVLGRKLVRT